MIFKLFITSLILLYSYALMYLTVELSKVFIISLILSAFIVGILVLKQYIKKRSPSRCGDYLLLLLLITGFMAMMTLINNLLHIGNYTMSTVIQDVIAIIIICSGYILTDKKSNNDENLMKYLKFIGVIAIISGIISFSFANFSLGRDENVWQPQYIWWGLLFPWSYLLLYKIIMKKNNIFWNVIAYGSTLMYIILGLLFGKRIVLVEVVAVVLIIVMIKKRRYKINLKTGLIIAGFAFLIIFALQKVFDLNFTGLFESTLMRFSDLSLKNFDRLNEFIDLFKEYPYTTILTGAGLGSYHHGPGSINLHIGWLNYIFKGGILFFLLETWVLSIAVKIFFKAKDNWHKYIAACVIYIYITIMITSSWVPTPLTMNFSIMKFALLRISESYKIKKNSHFEKS